MTYAVVVGLCLNLVVSLWVLGATMRRAAISRFRYTAWRARDGVVDAMLAGELDDSRTVREAVDGAESLIASADWVTPLRLKRAISVLRRVGEVPPRRSSYGDLPPEQRERLEAFDRELFEAQARLLLFGTFSGLALVAYVLVRYGTVALWRLISQGHKKNGPPRRSERIISHGTEYLGEELGAARAMPRERVPAYS